MNNYIELVRAVTSAENCSASGNEEWRARWEKLIEKIMKHAPSGSGVENGTELISCTDEKMIFSFDYHHMNDAGFYDGWTQHNLTVRPSFLFKIDLKISGSNRNQIKDYLYDVYRTWLMEECEFSP